MFPDSNIADLGPCQALLASNGERSGHWACSVSLAGRLNAGLTKFALAARRSPESPLVSRAGVCEEKDPLLLQGRKDRAVYASCCTLHLPCVGRGSDRYRFLQSACNTEL